MGRARHRGPLNWGTIGKIETVLDIQVRRWWPPEPKFKPYFLTDFYSCRRRIKNHPVCQACSNIHWRPNGRAHDNVARRWGCGVLVQHSRRNAPDWRLGRPRGVVSTRWLPRWHGGACGDIWNRRSPRCDRASDNVATRRLRRYGLGGGIVHGAVVASAQGTRGCCTCAVVASV